MNAARDRVVSTSRRGRSPSRRGATPWAITANLALLLVVGVAACSKATKQQEGEPAGHREHQAAAESGAGEHHGHEGRAHEEGSDLDRPVAELFAASCEHGVKTHACDECRYEVGVVEAPAELFDGGLLTLVEPERRSVRVPLRLTGEVEFDQRRVAHVGVQAEGVIRKVHVTLGDEVDAGQPLLEVESVEAGDAHAALLEARGELALKKRNHERLAALHDDGISSEKALFQAKQELDAAKIRVDAAAAKLARLGMASSAGRIVLRAPAAGTILQMHAVTGELAEVGESLVTVGDNAALWVWADLYERDLAKVMQAQRAEPLAAAIRVKAFPDRPFDGTVDFVTPAMSESSRTAKIRVAVPNEEGLLLAGMFAEVDLFLPGERKALTLPAEAVVADEGRSFVFVHHEGDYYVRRPVEVGRRLAGLVEITEGLEGGEAIVAEGAFLLKSDVLRSKMGAGCAD